MHGDLRIDSRESNATGPMSSLSPALRLRQCALVYSCCSGHFPKRVWTVTCTAEYAGIPGIAWKQEYVRNAEHFRNRGSSWRQMWSDQNSSN